MDYYNNESPDKQNQSNRPANPYLNPYDNSDSVMNPYGPDTVRNASPDTPYYTANDNPYFQRPANASGQPYNPYYPGTPIPAAPAKTPAVALEDRQRQLLLERLQTRPVWTYIFLAIIGLVFAGQLLTGGNIDGNLLDPFMQQGALVKSEVLRGEWWRLITPIFLHFGIMHILFNSMALYALGTQLERLIGQIRYVLIFFLSGLGGSILVLLLQSQQTITAGASGAVFGLMGALIGYFYRHRAVMGAWGAANLKNLLITAGINFVFTLAIPGISLYGHLGGALAGLVLGYLLAPLPLRHDALTGRAGANPASSGFLATWWPVVALLLVEGLLLYLAVQTQQPALRLR